MSDRIGVGGVDKDVFERVWAFVEALDDREEHFNNLQGRYRALASTWLLAAFAGVGFVFTQPVTAPFEPELMAIAVALAGAVGMTLLWVLDVLVYHELLVVGFSIGKQLEGVFSWLPPVRKQISELTKGSPVRRYIAAFYMSGITILCILAAFICWYWRGVWSVPFGVIVSVALVLDGVVVGMSARGLTWKRELDKNVQKWAEEAAAQGPGKL